MGRGLKSNERQQHVLLYGLERLLKAERDCGLGTLLQFVADRLVDWCWHETLLDGDWHQFMLNFCVLRDQVGDLAQEVEALNGFHDCKHRRTFADLEVEFKAAHQQCELGDVAFTFGERDVGQAAHSAEAVREEEPLIVFLFQL